MYIYRAWFRAGYSYPMLSNKKPLKEKAFITSNVNYILNGFIFKNKSASVKENKTVCCFLKVGKHWKKEKQRCLNQICLHVILELNKIMRCQSFFSLMLFNSNSVMFECYLNSIVFQNMWFFKRTYYSGTLQGLFCSLCFKCIIITIVPE